MIFISNSFVSEGKLLPEAGHDEAQNAAFSPDAQEPNSASNLHHAHLAAQCEIPPRIAQYLFEIVSQNGVSHPFCLVFMWYRASIAEIRFCEGGIATPLHMLSNGERSEKGSGVSHAIGHVETSNTP